MVEMVSSKNNKPYKGLNPYSEADTEIFFGRDKDTENIKNALTVSKLTILHGESGVGKSSVLRAGVAAHLQQEAKENIRNYGYPKFAVVVFPPSTGDRSWKDGDQEPLSSLMEQIEEDIREIAPDIQSRASDLSFVEVLQFWTKCLGSEEREGKLFIILDQFEEYFVYHPQDKNFAVELAKAVNDFDVRVNFLLGIRSDAFTKLDRFKGSIPNVGSYRLELTQLNETSAKEAITRPIEIYNKQKELIQESQIKIDQNLVTAVINETGIQDRSNSSETKRVEAPFLQLVMERLWDEEVGKNKSTSLRYDTFERLGKTQKIVKDYVDEKVSQLPDELKDAAGSTFHFFVTKAGYKLAHTADSLLELANNYRELIPLPSLDIKRIGKMLEELDRGRIVRTLPGERYEIFHDVLGPAILSWQSEYIRVVKDRNAEARAELERQAQEDRRQRMLGMVRDLIHKGWELDRESIRQDEKMALSARQAYLFNNHYRGDLVDKIDNLLRKALQQSHFSPIFSGHEDEIPTVAFSADANLFVSGSFDGTVRIYDPDKKESIPPLRLSKKDRGIISTAISGQKLAVGCGTGEVKLIYLDRPDAPVQTLSPSHSGDKKEVWTVAFSPDGQKLASGSWDKKVQVWDLEHSLEAPIFSQEHPHWIWSVAFSPKQTRLVKDIPLKFWLVLTEIDGLAGILFLHQCLIAVGCLDGSIRLWDLERPKEPKKILTVDPNWQEPDESEGRWDEVFCVAFSPKGDWLAAGSRDGKVWLWNLDDGNDRPEITLEGHEQIRRSVASVAFSSDGRILATAGDDRKIHLWYGWQEPNPQLTVLEKGHAKGVSSIAFSPDNRWLVSGSWDRTVRLWDLRPSAVEPVHLQKYGHPVRAIALRKQTLAAALNDRINKSYLLRLWLDISHPEKFIPLEGHGDEISAVALSGDGKWLASGSHDETVILWDLTPQEVKKEIVLKHDAEVSSIAFSHDGKWLASGSYDHTVRLWDLNERPTHQPRILRGHEKEVSAIAFSPDGKWLASGSYDQTVRLWNPQKLKDSPITIPVGEGKVEAIAFSLDGQFLALTTEREKVQFWDLRGLDITREPTYSYKYAALKNLKGLALVFCPYRRILASGTSDGYRWLWDLDRPNVPPIRLEGHTGKVTTLAFTEDGERLVSGSEDGTILIEIANVDTLAKMVCQKVWRNLTFLEWQDLVGADIPYEQTCPNLPPCKDVPPAERAEELKRDFEARLQRLFAGQRELLDLIGRETLIETKASPKSELSGTEITTKLGKGDKDYEAVEIRLDSLCDQGFLKKTSKGTGFAGDRYGLSQEYRKYLEITDKLIIPQP